ncbi:MAG: YezD family protein [Blautia sp.]|nr:YezD family protein [Blautia sp.]
MKDTEKKQILDHSHLGALESLLRDMKYGSITLIIQDGRIVQIDKTEKHRIKD